MNYAEFLDKKARADSDSGFDPIWIPEFLKDFQKQLVGWSIRKGRSALLEDCGLGKTVQELVWAENVVRKTNGRVIICTPLAVSYQTEKEGEKFGIECKRRSTGENPIKGITITNYERLHHFDSSDFAGIVCDESSILKNFNGATKAAITEFARPMAYRLLGTATAAPNDYHELGTSSDALGYLGYTDMLTRFFKEDVVKEYLGWGRKTYRFRGHSEEPFWRWVCSWARSVRKPSDLGFADGEFILPPLTEEEITVECSKPREGMLFAAPAFNLQEQRQERRSTIAERCDKATEIIWKHKGQSVAWCHLNDEGDYLETSIKGSKQVSGSMSDEEKEETLLAFQSGQLQDIIIKPKIGCFGLNWQNCHNIVTFASHSWEAYYQSIRRCWRFGQKHPVKASIIVSEGESRVLASMKRKSSAANRMFESLCKHMNNAMHIERQNNFTKREGLPTWF